jgi:hypothetical protein
MNILFTSLFGSKLYGTDTQYSDTDYKAVYLPTLTTLLRGDSIKNSVRSSDGANTEYDEDFEMIPLQVFMRDFIGGQSYAIEIAFNAIENESDCHPDFYYICCCLCGDWLTSDIRSMVGYAMNQSKKYGDKGARLNSLLEFSELIDNNRLTDKLSNVDFVRDASALCDTHKDINIINFGGSQNIAFSVLGKTFPADITFSEAGIRLDRMISKYGQRSKSASDGCDWKSISHSIRIIDQAISLLTDECIKFPLPNSIYYTDVKLGKYDWECVSECMHKRLSVLGDAQLNTKLPKCDDEFIRKFYVWYDSTIYDMYLNCIEPKPY